MERITDPKDRIIVALDRVDHAKACQWIEVLAPYVGMFKVGHELISQQEAGKVADYAASQQARIFWDSKLHDVPRTVYNSASAIADMWAVAMFSVHASGGSEMIQAATAAACNSGALRTTPRPLVLLGETVLTSPDYGNLVVRIRAVQLARANGLDGVVVSPHEIESIRRACGWDFLVVTPGVRPAGTVLDGHKRVMTPGAAIRAGADYLVIGRPILQPEQGTPVEAAQRIAEEIAYADSGMGGSDLSFILAERRRALRQTLTATDRNIYPRSRTSAAGATFLRVSVVLETARLR